MSEHNPTGYNLSVWKLRYRYSYHERVSTYGGMDSEPTGRILEAENERIIVAPTPEIVSAAFLSQHTDVTILSVDLIGPCDMIIRLDGTCHG